MLIHASLLGEKEQQAFIVELEQFIGRLLKMVELELNFDLLKHGKIRDQVHGEFIRVVLLYIYL